MSKKQSGKLEADHRRKRGCPRNAPWSKADHRKQWGRDKRWCVWGSKEYLEQVFDDIDTAKELSRKCVDLKAAKEIVKTISNKKNGMYVYKAFKCKCVGEVDGHPAEGEAVIVHVVIGTNSDKGVQKDYMLALAKLVSSGFRVIDCHVDAIDDLADLLCVFKRAK